MADPNPMINDVRVPRLLYGTAWKEERTQALTELALQQGFRGIDTANQRRHYDETGVGRGIRASLQDGIVTREELFLQTKFTFRSGQDHRLPYDPAAAIAAQVQQSFDSSLEHLGVTVIDSYVLHGPSQSSGLGSDDWEAWRAMEEIFDSERVRLLGVSNVNFEQLRLLYERARVKPRFVQNRCFAARGWDRRIREFCAANDIIYQGFSLLTANQAVLNNPLLSAIARRHGRTVPQVVFRFALQIGILPLTGTTSIEHMREDLEVFQFRLDDEELEQIERAGET